MCFSGAIRRTSRLADGLKSLAFWPTMPPPNGPRPGPGPGLDALGLLQLAGCRRSSRYRRRSSRYRRRSSRYRETQHIGEKVKPWGLLAVIVLVWYLTPLKNAFFDLVDSVYGLIGGNDALHYFGYLFFKFWTKNPA